VAGPNRDGGFFCPRQAAESVLPKGSKVPQAVAANIGLNGFRCMFELALSTLMKSSLLHQFKSLGLIIAALGIAALRFLEG